MNEFPQIRDIAIEDYIIEIKKSIDNKNYFLEEPWSVKSNFLNVYFGENIFWLDKKLLNNIKYLREYCVKNEIMNDINEFPECETPKDLILTVVDVTDEYSRYKISEMITDELIEDRDFVVKLLKKNID